MGFHDSQNLYSKAANYYKYRRVPGSKDSSSYQPSKQDLRSTIIPKTELLPKKPWYGDSRYPNGRKSSRWQNFAGITTTVLKSHELRTKHTNTSNRQVESKSSMHFFMPNEYTTISDTLGVESSIERTAPPDLRLPKEVQP